jgi:exopolyphosphatase/pppGpp-phosphohydrolase
MLGGSAMAKFERLAALDVGGNTVHLLISLRPVAQRVDLLELGRATATDRTFSRATIRRLAKTVRSFAVAVRKADARLIAAATEATGQAAYVRAECLDWTLIQPVTIR